MSKNDNQRLVPLMTPGSNHLFVDVEDVDPWIVPNTENATSALKIGTRLNLLTIATTPDMIEMGLANNTDSVDINAYLDQLFYKTKNGRVHKLDVHWLTPAMTFQRSAAGRLELCAALKVDPLGVKVTWIDRVVHWFHDRFGHRQMVPVTVTGTIYPELGTVEVDAKPEEGSGITVIGYTLNCQRVNLNRVARQPEPA